MVYWPLVDLELNFLTREERKPIVMEEKTLCQNIPQGHDENRRAHHPLWGGGGGEGVSGAVYGKSRHIIIRLDRYPSRPI